MFGNSGFGGCGNVAGYGTGGHYGHGTGGHYGHGAGGFALIVVLFILLIIVGTAFYC